MKALIAAALVAGAAALAAPAAHAAPTLTPSSVALRGGVGIGVGVGFGGGYRHGGYVAARPYWGVTGYSTQPQTVLAGYDQYGRPVYTSRWVSVPVYGWIYPAAPVRVYRPHVRPHVSVGLGFRF
jgi:hypothetical protein